VQSHEAEHVHLSGIPHIARPSLADHRPRVRDKSG
jgi:hypothetical protein